MNRVRDQDVDWIRHDAALAETLHYAIPEGYEAYGVLDLPRNIAPVEDGLLDTLTASPSQPLIAGWIDRGPWAPPPGDEHVLYTGWRYSLRHVRASELRGLRTEGEGSFPDLLFPLDRSWLVSLLWDDSWRSIGASQTVVSQLARDLPNFEQLSPHKNLPATGRVQSSDSANRRVP